MSDDQSYYEIQLNFPHLVLGFLAAAVVGIALFWFGVVIGSGQGDAAGGPEWQAAVAGEQAETPAGEDPLEFYEEVSEPAAQPPGANPPAGAEQPTTPPAESSVAAPEFQPADPVDEPRDPVMAESSSGRPTEDAALATGWIVQVRSTPDESSAETLQAALAVAGFPAFVVSADVNGQTYYRVRVGRYAVKSDAETIEAELLTRSDIETTWVTQG